MYDAKLYVMTGMFGVSGILFVAFCSLAIASSILRARENRSLQSDTSIKPSQSTGGKDVTQAINLLLIGWGFATLLVVALIAVTGSGIGLIGLFVLMIGFCYPVLALLGLIANGLFFVKLNKTGKIFAAIALVTAIPTSIYWVNFFLVS